MNHQRANVMVSIVVPVYRGEDSLPRLVERIGHERDRWKSLSSGMQISEAIFVLDGPLDRSAQVLEDLGQEHPWIRVVELSKNFGQHSATAAGVLYSSGDWVVTLDEDLQHDPGKIVEMLDAAVGQQVDIVYAMPKGAVHGGGYRDWFSRMTKRWVARLAGSTDITRFNSFRLIRGDVARGASSICAQHTYFDLALTWYTDRIVSLEMEMKDERFESKKSGYSFWRLVQHAKRMILTSDFHVLRFSVSATILTALTAVLYGAWIVYRKFFTAAGYEVAGWPSLALMILLFGAITIFLLGLLVEFTRVTMLQLQGKPAFFVVSREKDGLVKDELPRLMDDADSRS